MKYPKNQLAQMVIQLCEYKKLQHIVISPGSRNAPLIIGFSNHTYFKSYSIVDERCAAFFALGIAQKRQEPVVLVCTSGSALLNYYPAIAEAFFSDIPLVVLSADRPDYLIGIGDGQTINQKNVFTNHILYSANLKHDMNNDADFEYNQTEINAALNLAINNKGPVHINIPFEEPLYDLVDEFSIEVKSTSMPKITNQVDTIEAYQSIWNSAKRKLILVGVNHPDTINQKYLDALAKDNSVIVFTETTSNLHHDSFFSSIDKMIAPLSNNEFKALQPDILLTFGGMIVSKKVKAFLREYKPKYHWHIDEKKANDTFFCLNKHFKMSVNTFFSQLLSDNKSGSDYQSYWQNIKVTREKRHQEYINTITFGDLKVFDIVLKTLPNYSNIQLGNSSTVRYVQLFNLNKTLHVYCNRGTSGIDGSTSTAIGSALMSKSQTICITGDLSFFYDSNALWNAYIPNTFRIIVINNSGGGIFRILPGHKNTTNFETYFETIHDLNAEQLCEMYNFEHVIVTDESELKLRLNRFYQPSETPKLLEIITPRQINDEVLLQYFNYLNN